MNRTIVFRGMTMDKKWIFGSLVLTTMGNTKTWIVRTARGNGGWFNVIRRDCVKPETVGQFTGLSDKNGIKIFEGDIARASNTGNTGEIKYIPENGSFVVASTDKDGRYFEHVDMGHCQAYFEVIGNIHE